MDEARAVLDLERELIGIYIAGRDVDFARVTVRLLNINSEPILFADDELDWPVDMDQNDGPDGVFSVYGTTDFQGRVAARAARAVELLAWDRLGLVSMPLVTLFVEPTPRALGEGCDPNGLVDPCADEAHACLGVDLYRCVMADP